MAWPITDVGGDQKQDYYMEWPKCGKGLYVKGRRFSP